MTSRGFSPAAQTLYLRSHQYQDCPPGPGATGDFRVTFWTPKGDQQQEAVDLQVLDCTVTWTGEAIASEIKTSRLRVL
jgi:hypothetical protein